MPSQHPKFLRARAHRQAERERKEREREAAREALRTLSEKEARIIDPARWPVETVYVIGGGKSASRVDLQALRGRGIVVAVNDSALHLPWADVVFSANSTWIRRRLSLIEGWEGVATLAVPPRLQDAFDYLRHAEVLESRPGVLPGSNPSIVVLGHNSGSAALNMALAKGAKSVVLVGFDMDAADPGHWHGGYKWRSRWGPEHYATWAESLSAVAEALPGLGASVLNANPESAIRCFPFVEPESLPL